MHADLLDPLDNWVSRRDEKLSRADAVRSILRGFFEGEHVALPPETLTALDAWIAKQPDPKPSRPAAIREMVRAMLHILAKDK